MNEKLKNFGKEELKKGLAKCTEDEQNLFKQMYAFEYRGKDIDYVVDHMPEEKIDWAMQQVERTLAKKQVA